MSLLADLQSEYVQYSRDHMKVSMSAARPAVPGTVNPDEDFTFDVTVRNGSVTRATGAIDGFPVVNLRILLRIEAGPGHLIVPALPAIREVRSDAGDTATVLSPGQVVEQMYIYPVVTHMRAGEELTIKDLKGKAGAGLGNFAIVCYAHATVDMDWLFREDFVYAALATIAVIVV
jgi:hypothetical protein